MLLLYCQNGIVVGSHDDASPVVDPTAYGDGVRVIPWKDNTLSTLDKVGTLPPPNPVAPDFTIDPRPYGEPTETPELLMAYAAQQRWEVSTQGVPFTAASGSIPADTNRLSQGLISSLAQYAATLSPTDTINFTQNNVAYTITAQEAADLFNQVNVQVQNARNIEAQCIADLTSASPTILTYDDVDAKFTAARRVARKPYRAPSLPPDHPKPPEVIPLGARQ